MPPGSTDEYAEIGNGFNRTGDFVSFVVVGGKFFPRIGLALFHTQRDTAAAFVDFQNHDFDFVTQLYDFARVYVLLVQSISETCTKPSMPCSISTNAP